MPANTNFNARRSQLNNIIQFVAIACIENEGNTLRKSFISFPWFSYISVSITDWNVEIFHALAWKISENCCMHHFSAQGQRALLKYLWELFHTFRNRQPFWSENAGQRFWVSSYMRCASNWCSNMLVNYVNCIQKLKARIWPGQSWSVNITIWHWYPMHLHSMSFKTGLWLSQYHNKLIEICII